MKKTLNLNTLLKHLSVTFMALGLVSCLGKHDIPEANTSDKTQIEDPQKKKKDDNTDPGGGAGGAGTGGFTVEGITLELKSAQEGEPTLSDEEIALCKAHMDPLMEFLGTLQCSFPKRPEGQDVELMCKGAKDTDLAEVAVMTGALKADGSFSLESEEDIKIKDLADNNVMRLLEGSSISGQLEQKDGVNTLVMKKMDLSSFQFQGEDRRDLVCPFIYEAPQESATLTPQASSPTSSSASSDAAPEGLTAPLPINLQLGRSDYKLGDSEEDELCEVFLENIDKQFVLTLDGQNWRSEPLVTNQVACAKENEQVLCKLGRHVIYTLNYQPDNKVEIKFAERELRNSIVKQMFSEILADGSEITATVKGGEINSPVPEAINGSVNFESGNQVIEIVHTAVDGEVKTVSCNMVVAGTLKLLPAAELDERGMRVN